MPIKSRSKSKNMSGLGAVPLLLLGAVVEEGALAVLALALGCCSVVAPVLVAIAVDNVVVNAGAAKVSERRVY